MMAISPPSTKEKDAEELDVDLVATTFRLQEGSYGSEPDFPLIEQLKVFVGA